MPVKSLQGGIDVVEAARRRIVNIFGNGLPVYLAFSGGKDSICLAQLTLDLIRERKISPAQLTVYFLDEEAIYSCIEKTVLEWRKKFMMAGAKFQWWCIECRHYNCFNNLRSDESFICWDSTKRDVWVRQPPPFAIREHPIMRARKDTYQDFFAKLLIDGINMIGVRVAESVQRRQNIASIKTTNNGLNGTYKIFPIYDWKDSDVWLYLAKRKVDIPEIYVYLWRTGTRKANMRVSQFFSVDTARSLVKLNEYYPDLMERVIRREPNAYLAMLYWDSEMFGRSSSKRRELEKDEKPKDYRALLEDLFKNLPRNFTTTHSMDIARKYRMMYIKFKPFLKPRLLRRMYEALIAGIRSSETIGQYIWIAVAQFRRKER